MNSFGRIFKIEIFGESHGESVGVVIDGCPAGISLAPDDLLKDLKKRMPVSKGTTERKEKDIPVFKSGVYNGRTTGSPIMIEFINKDVRSSDYEKFKDIPRPGQSDYAAGIKFGGFNDHRGGGHFSARLTIGIVAAGCVAKKIMNEVAFKSKIIEAGGEKSFKNVINDSISEGDTLGGIIECTADNIPAGTGEPFFDSVESVISHIMFSIPSVKAVEFGAGISSSRMKGSEYNDMIIDKNGKTSTNNSGGITGGITNGNQVIFRVCFRPPSSVGKKQKTISLRTGKLSALEIKGRHDVCPVLRAAVIVEAAAAIAVCDLIMINKLNLHKY